MMFWNESHVSAYNFQLEYGIAKRLSSYHRAHLTLPADIYNSHSRFCAKPILLLETVTISVHVHDIIIWYTHCTLYMVDTLLTGSVLPAALHPVLIFHTDEMFFMPDPQKIGAVNNKEY